MQVKVERNEDFYTAARELSDFISTLPLSHTDNDRLISLMCKQVEAAERSAYLAAFDKGVKLGLASANGELDESKIILN